MCVCVKCIVYRHINVAYNKYINIYIYIYIYISLKITQNNKIIYMIKFQYYTIYIYDHSY